MSELAQSMDERYVSTRVERGNSDTPASAAMLARNVEEVLRWMSASEAIGQGANSGPQHTFTGREQNVGAKVIDPAPTSVRFAQRASFRALQEWEGYVTSVDKASFVARLADVKSSASHDEEEAVIPRTELSDADDTRLRVGHIFRWVIGYEQSPAGTKRRVSQIVFRDLPAITLSDLQEGEDWAQEIARSLNP